MFGERSQKREHLTRWELLGRGRSEGRIIYLPGQGILPHTDGPAYEPIVTILSLNSHTILTLQPSPTFYPPPPKIAEITSSPPPTSGVPATIHILIPPRSLFVMSSTLYSTYLHSIEARKMDTMEELKACVNWEEYLVSEDERLVAAAAGEGTENGVVSKSEQEASRRMVEAGMGWERGRRVSLTCRRVSKVRRGIKLG
ncbi:hypothetical protein P7C70_g2347, partial [Phenoliferia sp. Uapishka_3]